MAPTVVLIKRLFRVVCARPEHPVGRFAAPEEIASVVAYLLSPGAGYITGSFYPADGGFGAQ